MGGILIRCGVRTRLEGSAAELTSGNQHNNSRRIVDANSVMGFGGKTKQ